MRTDLKTSLRLFTCERYALPAKGHHSLRLAWRKVQSQAVPGASFVVDLGGTSEPMHQLSGIATHEITQPRHPRMIHSLHPQLAKAAAQGAVARAKVLQDRKETSGGSLQTAAAHELPGQHN